MKFHYSYLTPLLAFVALTPESPDRAPLAGINVKSAAGRIDRILESDMKRGRVTPNPLADDATFVRRAYVGIVGRIPTGQETLQFLNSQGQTKRAKLVDRLLDSKGFESNMFNFWADLLRVKTRLNNNVSGEPFMHFLKESIAKNEPYDKFVREMLVAEGAAHKRGNGATGLLMRDRAMPLDSMANTVRVFLGTRLECAQCHDHPFDKWKQKDFYAMAAFTGGINYRPQVAQTEAGEAIRKVYAEMRNSKDRNGQRALGRMLRQVNTGITGTGTGVIRLPKDYQYEDGKPYQPVLAHTIFGKTPKVAYKKPSKKQKPRYRRGMNARQRAKERQRVARLNKQRGRQRAPEVNSRTAYADWLTDKRNPRFTKVIANRMWKHVMGRGLIEPVDNIMENTKPSNQALMSYLERLMIDVDYDLKGFLRVLYNTTAFQREATKKEVPMDQKYHFQGPVLRRMTAEQVWDSMLTLVVPDLDAKVRAPDARASFVYTQYENILNMPEGELRKRVKFEKLRYTNPQQYRKLARERRSKQQSERRAAQRAAQRKAQANRTALRKRAQPLYKALYKARRAKDEARIAEIKGRLKKLGIDLDGLERRRRMGGRRNRNRGGAGQLVRASDLPQPAPNGHFLRQFGQSDRDQIQASHTEANVPQVLSLLNGFVEKQILGNPTAELMLSIERASSSKEKVRRAYLGVLSREPRGREAAVWAHDIETVGEEAVRDLVWTLANTHEFRFLK